MKKTSTPNYTFKYLLIVAVVLAFFLRFWRISTLPFPPNGDELAFGYYGWSLLHFGTDEYGNFFPPNFVSIGDFKYPGLAYLNILPASVFGLSEITVRFWSALSGVILVYLIYKISLIIFENKIAALASSWIIALSPWSIIESRFGWENHLSMVITTSAIYLILKNIYDINRKKKKWLFPSILLILSTYIYGAQRFFIPAFLSSLSAISFLKHLQITKFKKSLIILTLIITGIVVLSLSANNNRGRSKEELWKLSPTDTNRLEELYVSAGTSTIHIPARLTWLFHNKYRIALSSFFERYTNHFSPNFLFFFGEASAEKIPDMGILSYLDILLLPAGFLTLLVNKRNNEKILILLIWLFVAPIASALTFGGPHINRASLLIPPLAIISGWGFYNLIDIFKNRLRWAVIGILFVMFVYSSFFGLNQIFIQKPTDKPWLREQVYKEVSMDILKLLPNYKAVVANGDDYIYFLFYGKITPAEFIKDSDITPLSDKNIWERVGRMKNIYFKMPFECPKSGKLNVLYVCSGSEIPQNTKVIKAYYFLDGVPAFTLVEFYPLSKLPKTLPETPKGLHYMVDVEKSINYPDGIIPADYPSMW